MDIAKIVNYLTYFTYWFWSNCWHVNWTHLSVQLPLPPPYCLVIFRAFISLDEFGGVISVLKLKEVEMIGSTFYEHLLRSIFCPFFWSGAGLYVGRKSLHIMGRQLQRNTTFSSSNKEILDLSKGYQTICSDRAIRQSHKKKWTRSPWLLNHFLPTQLIKQNRLNLKPLFNWIPILKGKKELIKKKMEKYLTRHWR